MQIYLQSKIGEGTTFQMYLPPVEGATDVVEAPIIAPQPLQSSETVLIVEDNDAVRRIAREF